MLSIVESNAIAMQQVFSLANVCRQIHC